MNYFFYLYDMKVIIWIKTKDFKDFTDGKNVKYWNSEPWHVKCVVSVIIESDRYQQLMDGGYVR